MKLTDLSIGLMIILLALLVSLSISSLLAVMNLTNRFDRDERQVSVTPVITQMESPTATPSAKPVQTILPVRVLTPVK